MTNIKINDIQISYKSLIVNINSNSQFFDLSAVSNLLKHIDEKTIKVYSYIHRSYNDYNLFENKFLFVLNRLLSETNYNYYMNLKEPFKYPYWVISNIRKETNSKNILKDLHQHNTELDKGDLYFVATIKNLKGETLED